jgi:hypothetical protein
MSRELSRQLAPKDRPLWEKTKDIWKTYLAIPSILEDMQRMTLGLNGLRMGYSPAEATRMISKNYPNYRQALSKFENEWMKRLIPFYAYQRLIIPMVLKKTIQKPGDAATINKVYDVVGKLMGGDGEDIPPADREVFDQGILIEQPRVFEGRDENGNLTFKVGGGLQPWDLLDLVVTDSITKKVDYKRTFGKTFLAQLTPFIKIPLELAAGKQFFSNRSLENAGRLGRVSDETMSGVLPDPIKELIGWEVHRDGKVYINPYLAYTNAIVFPFLNRFTKNTGGGVAGTENPLNQAMDLFMAVRTEVLDPKEAASELKMFEDRELREIRKELKEARKNLQPESYEKVKDDYRELMRVISARRQARMGRELGELLVGVL